MNKQQTETMGFSQFAWQATKGRIFAITVSAGAGVLILLQLKTAWSNWIDPLLTVLTLGVAAFVWLGQKREEWEEYLPNRLTVHFYHGGMEVMRCEKAHLTAESDIRALAQQIGAQMSKARFLDFVAPGVEVSPPQLDKEGRFLHYSAKFVLTELPEGLCADSMLIWKEPFTEPPRKAEG